MKTNSSTNRSNNYNRNSAPRKPKKLVMYVPFAVEDDVSDELYDELLSVIEQTPFNKISYVLSSPRHYYEEDTNGRGNKLVTVGYIQGYDANTKVFSVVIFNNFYDTISNFPMAYIVPQYLTRKDGSLGTITKINIIPYNTASSEPVPVDESTTETAEEYAGDFCAECMIPQEAVVGEESVLVAEVDEAAQGTVDL